MKNKKSFIIILSIIILLWVAVWWFFAIKANKKTLANPITSNNNVATSINNEAKVISFFPVWTIDNLDQTVLISFSQPMVPLKILDQQSACPLTIEPLTKWECRWISTQTVEFTPEQWKPATKYIATIKWSGSDYTWAFSTPLLKRNIWQNESLSKWIRLIFNFQVKLDQLQKTLTVTNTNKRELIPVNIAEDTIPWNYILKPVTWVWDYLTTYTFAITWSLDSQEWNIPTELSILSYTTTDSIVNVDTLKAVNSWTEKWVEYSYYNNWLLNNTQNNETNTASYWYDNFYEIYNTPAKSSFLLPNKDVVLDTTFAEVINKLSNDIIRFTQNDKPVNYTLSYVPESIWDQDANKYRESLTKKKIRITITDTLVQHTMYRLSYAPDGKNIISKREFNTADKIKINRILPISYAKICLYSNNPLNLDKPLLTTNPTSRIQSIEQEETLPESLMYQDNLNIKKSELDKFLTKYDLCPAPKQDEIVYVINTRLSPSSKYKLTFTPTDIYGNTMTQPMEQSFSTEKIKDKDKFIYIWHPEKNTIPSDAPIVIDVQSINTDKADIKVCVMNIQDYLNNKYSYDNTDQQTTESYLNEQWSGVSIVKGRCAQSWNKSIQIKNKNWILSDTKLDVEKDILWKKIENHIVRVSWKLPTQDPIAKTRTFSSIFIKSNLSIMLEAWTNKKILLVTTYDGKPITGITFEWFNRDNFVWGYVSAPITAKYNDKKWVYELANWADAIVASKWDYRGMLDNETDITDNYDFGYIAWQDSAEKEFLYLYTERPLYKPWDTVYFKWLLRNFNFDGFKKAKTTDGTLVISNEQWNELSKVTVKLDKNSNFNGSFVLPKEMNLWGYTIRYTKKDQSEIQTNAIFFVEEYKKPVFKIDIDSWQNDVIVWDNINISINPTYYFGGKIADTAGTYSIFSQNYFFNAKDYSNFQFGEWNDYINCMYRDECNYMDRAITVDNSNFMIDKNWNYKLNYKAASTEKEQLYSFIFEVKDPTTLKPVSKTVSKVIHATDWYVGIQLPYRNTTKQWIKLNAVVLDREAQAKWNSKVTVKLIKQNRKAIKKQGIDWVFYNDYSLEEKTELSENITTDNLWMIEKTLMPQSDWEYKVSVSYVGKSGIPFVSSQVVYVSWNDPLLRRTENNSVTKVIAEKTMVNVWDNAQYTIQSPINTGIIFVSIQKDDGILDYFTMPLTDYATKLVLPIKKEFYPNIYIKAFLIGSQKDNPLPIYKRWLAISKVNAADQKLQVKVSTDKEFYLPWDKPQIEVSVSDSKGMPIANANLSVGIVDQSLLALKGNPIKNPFAFFYDMKRYLWTLTSLSLKTLVDKLEIKNTDDGSKWWDWWSMKWWNSKKKRWVFKDTAYRNANITTDSKWIAKITADALPDNLTTWVVESLVNTDDTKVGVSTKDIQTALPLMINPNLPSMLSIDDKIILHPVVFNKTNTEQTVNFIISGTHLTIKNSKKNIKIPAKWQTALDFEVEIIGKDIPYDAQLASKITMTATTTHTNIRDDVQLWIPIIQNATKETVTTVWAISGWKAQEAIEIPSDLQWSLTFTYSKSLFGSLLDGIDMSLLWNYWCLEQRFSTFMPHVYAKKLYESAGKWSDYDLSKLTIKQRSDGFDGYQNMPLNKYIDQQLISMERFQNSDWWFVFRYDNMYPQTSSVWLTDYIISSLSKLRDLWFTIPKDIPTLAIKYLKTNFYKAQKDCNNTTSESCKAFAQEAMTTISAILDRDSQDKETLTMRDLIDPLTKDSNDTTDILKKAILLGKLSIQKESYKTDIKNIVTKVINEQLVMEPRTAHIGRDTSSDNIIDTAYLLQASTYAPELNSKYSTVYDALQRWIAEQKKDWSRGSTQDTVNVIESLTRFISTNPIPQSKIDIDTLIGKQTLQKISLAKDDPFTSQKQSIDITKINNNADIQMSSDSQSKSYYDITMSYFLPAKDIRARYEWFIVKKEYYKYEDYMDIANKKSVEWNDYIQGKISYKSLKYPKAISTYLQQEKNPQIWEVLITLMTIITSEPREQVAIENFVPAGSELINPHLSTESKYSWQNEILNENNEWYYGMEGNIQEVQQPIIQAFTCDREEFRTQQYFCYKENLDPWVYTVTSMIRITHAWTFSIKPTMVFEFYHPENFGRTIGMTINVAK